jgi:Resolvase, N terminal domain
MAVTRVCLYTRISTHEENQPTSLHSQRERLEAFCRAQEGWRIVSHHEDRATGTKLDRPGLQAALELARNRGSTCYSPAASTASPGRCGGSPSSLKNLTVTGWCCARRPIPPPSPTRARHRRRRATEGEALLRLLI